MQAQRQRTVASFISLAFAVFVAVLWCASYRHRPLAPINSALSPWPRERRDGITVFSYPVNGNWNCLRVDALATEADWLLSLRKHDDGLTHTRSCGWTWFVDASHDHTLMARGIGGQLHLSIHSIKTTYENRDDYILNLPDNLPEPVRVSKLGITLATHDYRAFVLAKSNQEWADFRDAPGMDPTTWRHLNAHYDVHVIELPIWQALLPFLILPFFSFVVIPIRRKRRLRSHHCACCNYNLTALTEPRCPECGTPVPS